jgi:HSP20 family protein
MISKKSLLACALLTASNLSANFFGSDFFSTDFFKEINEMENKFNNISMYKNKKTQKFTVEVALPGFDKKDIKVKIDNNTGLLSVTAECKLEQKEEEKNEKNIYIHKSQSIEQKYFHRSFTLPSYVNYTDADKIETSYKNGILKIEFPLGEKEKKHEVTLKINGSDDDESDKIEAEKIETVEDTIENTK